MSNTGGKSTSDGIGTKRFSNGLGTRSTETLSATSTYVSLSWTNPIGGVAPTGYQVKRWITGYNDDHPTFLDCDSYSTSSACYSATSYRDSRLRSSVTFNYAVRLVKRAEGEDPRWSPWSNTVTIEIPATLMTSLYPATPTGLTAVEVLHTTSSPKISISWNVVAGTSTYTIIRTDLKSATPTPVAVATGLTTTTYDDTDISPYRSYEYRVKAVNSMDLSSPLSQLRVVNTSGLQYGVPDRSTDLNATTTDLSATSTDAADTMITLSWTAAVGGATSTSYAIYAGVVSEEEYRAYEHPEDAIIRVRYTKSATSTSTTFAVRTGSLYAFGVKACNETGCSSLSKGLVVNLIGELTADPDAPGQPTMPSTG